jgi:hypothetical protein
MPETARRGASAPGDDASTVMFVGFINVATSCVAGDLVRAVYKAAEAGSMGYLASRQRHEIALTSRALPMPRTGKQEG